MKNRKHTFPMWWEQLFARLGLGMRAKLITLFVVIKLVPLVVLASLAWYQAEELGGDMLVHIADMTRKAQSSLSKAGEIAVRDVVKGLNERVTVNIERIGTDTALRIADFLYERDNDILLAAALEQKEAVYRAFLASKQYPVVKPGPWELAPDGKSWQRAEPFPPTIPSRPVIEENATNYRYRPPELFAYEKRPLYREITFLDLQGKELLKVVSDGGMDAELKDVSRRRNTYVKAENYFEHLPYLKTGEIYVSDVIGEYVGAKIQKAYTPEHAEEAGIPFEPEQSAYASQENPLGKKFQGLIRWAVPVEREGQRIGYVTLALDHAHIMEFVDHITPTPQRYTEIPDASEGDYAFIWDHKGRSIAHPRHFFIAGYDAATGEPQIPWLEESIYQRWQQSGQPYADFIRYEPIFVAQSKRHKPAEELTRQGLVGLDCRYLNFAPQCTGWFNLTRNGGSGSFLIRWSGVWKVTSAASIPYYTGQYGHRMRGFGIVTIGVGLSTFHRQATETSNVVNELIRSTDSDLKSIASHAEDSISKNLFNTTMNLAVPTLAMGILVIFIAIWMASAFTRKITSLIAGIRRFRKGERDFRFNDLVKDEIGALADSFDEMADSIVESFQYAEIILDLNYKILYINEPALALMQKTKEELLGTHYADSALLPLNSAYCPVSALLQGTVPEVMQHENNRCYQGNATHLTDAKGENIGFIITINDITSIIEEQRQNEQQRILLETVFSASPDPMWYEDRQGRFLAANPRFASLAGLDPADIRGRRAEEFSSFKAWETVKYLGPEAKSGGAALHTEELVTFADGHQETMDVVRTPLFNSQGEHVGLLGVARDISQRVEAENKLRSIQIELEKAALQANKASESKSAFLASMSHEIRTPMNAIIGMADISLRKLDHEKPPIAEVREHVRQIEFSSVHLLGLLNDILDISKIEAGKIEILEELFDLRNIADEVATTVQQHCLEKQISLKVIIEELGLTNFVSDALRLRQVLINLLSNAVKFTPENGSIVFRIAGIERMDGKTLVEFSVSDTGIGMPESLLATLFEPFEQGGSQVNKRYGGTGLGLSISKNIVNLLGGDIRVSSEEGQGSTFSFALWLREDSRFHDEAVSSSAVSFSGKRILLVDDVAINRLIVTEQLSHTGLEVEEAENGLAALEKFQQSPENHYDIILMDVQMPGMDGYEASAAIRGLGRPDAATVPIIALTANAFKEDVERALSHGMSAHLSKPLDVGKMLSLLKSFL